MLVEQPRRARPHRARRCSSARRSRPQELQAAARRRAAAAAAAAPVIAGEAPSEPAPKRRRGGARPGRSSRGDKLPRSRARPGLGGPPHAGDLPARPRDGASGVLNADARLVLGRRPLRRAATALDLARAVDARGRAACATARTCSTSAASRRGPAPRAVPVDEEIARARAARRGAREALRGAALDRHAQGGGRRGRARRPARAIVNDVSGLRYDPALAGVVARARRGARARPPARRRPRRCSTRSHYDDVVAEVARRAARERSRARARPACRDERIASIRASASASGPQDNLALLAESGELRERLGAPGAGRAVAQGASSASSRATPPAERDAATHAACAVAVFAGADAVRVHDVAGARARCAVARALRGARGAAIGRARDRVALEPLLRRAARASSARTSTRCAT